MRLISAKDVLWFLYLSLFRPAARWLPASLAYAAARVLEPACHVLMREDKRRLREQLVKAFGSEACAGSTEAISRRYVRNAVVRSVDDLYAGRTATPVIEGLEHLNHALSAGRGAMIVNLHFFANRAAKRCLARMGYPMLSVRNPYPHRHAAGRFGERYVRRRYGDFLHEVIGDEVAVDDPDCTLKIFQRLREGGLVNIYLDGYFSHEKVTCPFLGGERKFPAGFLRIARLTSCAIVSMVCLGHARQLRIRFDEPFRLELHGNPAEFLAGNLKRLACIMESQVRDHPDQWELWPRARI